jgi:diketogulonate reductase-like aldo/keto reductase
MKITKITDSVRLSNGVHMPWLGLGTFQSAEGNEVEQSVRWALDVGYRHIDTASVYRNERGVGKAIRASGVPRKDIFVTTKVWNDAHRRGHDAVLKAVDESLERLGMDYVDLYLVHWPVKGMYKEAWRAVEAIYATGKAKAIGVSNFMVHHLKDLLPTVKVKPMVNQIEFHPWLMQRKLMEFCREHQIVQEAWAPLIKGQVANIPEIQSLARRHGKTEAQIVLRWDIQLGVVTIPKSVRRERVIENAGIFDFELSPEEMESINRLDTNHRTGADPDHFTF